jgi:CDP-6-deoxy-D-xylo-4-hexulose-3-dehydrase
VSGRAAEVAALVARHLAPAGEVQGLPLAVSPFGAAEVEEAIAALLDGQVTMGPRVAAFEEAWAACVGARHAVMVNSGSSALLVLWTALLEVGALEPDEEVVVPAVAWSTSLSSALRAGLRVRLVDVDPRTLCVEGEHEQAVLAVHLLGQPSRARSRRLLLEDACAAHGAQVDGVRVGARGAAGAFSFFFSHHITTGEGGMICLQDDRLADACRSLRAHGWVRERSDRAWWAAQRPDLDPRFLFVDAGYNLRPPEVAGAFGLRQLPRLEGYVETRNRNHREWCAALRESGLPVDVFDEAPGTRHAGFGFPLLLRPDARLGRAELCAGLEARGVATRAISGANLAAQPAFSGHPRVRVDGPLPVAEAVHARGLFVGNSHAFGPAQGELLLDALRALLG